jgi:hypothetical protein
MWKPEHRLAADRRGLCYPSDLTDAQWGIDRVLCSRTNTGTRLRCLFLLIRSRSVAPISLFLPSGVGLASSRHEPSAARQSASSLRINPPLVLELEAE